MKKFQNMRDAWAYMLSEESIKKNAGCPKGYQWDETHKMCKPIEQRSNKDMTADQMPSYRVWGRTGLNGDGYAWEDKGGNWGSDSEAGRETKPMSEAGPAGAAAAGAVAVPKIIGVAKKAAKIASTVAPFIPQGGGGSSRPKKSSSSNSVGVSHGTPIREGEIANQLKSMIASKKQQWDQQGQQAKAQAQTALKKVKKTQAAMDAHPFVNNIKEGRLDLTSRKRTWKDPRNGDAGSRRSNTAVLGRDPANGDEGRRAPTGSLQGNGNTGRGGKTYEQMAEAVEKRCPRCSTTKSKCRCIGNSGYISDY